MIGSSLVRFALIWWLTKETDSAGVLATASVVTMLPSVLVGPFAGTFVDRWNRKWTMIISDGLIAFLTLGLGYLYWQGIAAVWHVYAIMFLRALGGVFQDPAMRASTTLLVPEDQLSRVGGMNETLMGVVNIVSPLLGALLIEVLSMQGTLAIDIVTAILAIGPLLVLEIPQPEIDVAGKGARSFWQDLGDGLRYVWSWQGLFFMFVVLAVLRIFMAPCFSFLPLMITRHFGGEALELGWMNSANGLGIIAGGSILSLWGGFKRRTVTAVVGLAGVGVGWLLFGLIPGNAFWVAMLIMFLRTTMLPMVRGPVLAIFQAHVPAELQGRVFTLLISSMSLMAPIGLAVGGAVVEAFGVRILFVLGGIGCLIVTAIWAASPAILYMEDRLPASASE